MPKRNRNKKRAQISTPGSSSSSTFQNPIFSNPHLVTLPILPGSSRSSTAACMQSRRLGSGTASDLQSRDRFGHSPLISQPTGTSRLQHPVLFPALTSAAGIGNTPLFQRPTPAATSVNRNLNSNINNTTTPSNANITGHTSPQATNASKNLFDLLNPHPANSPSISIDRSAAVSARSAAHRMPPPAPRNASRTTWPNLNGPAPVPQNGDSNKENTPGRSTSNGGTESTTPFSSPAWSPGSTAPSAYPRLTRANSGWEPVTQPRPLARDAHGYRSSDAQRAPAGESTSLASNSVFPVHQAAPHRWHFPFTAAGTSRPPAGPSTVALTNPWHEQSAAINLFNNNLGMAIEYETSAAPVGLYTGSSMFQGSPMPTDNPWARSQGYFGIDNLIGSEDEFEETPSGPSSAHPESPNLIGLSPRAFSTQEANNNSARENEVRDEAPSAREGLPLRELAEEASVLLEVYSRTAPGENEGENHDMIKSIFENVSKIWDKYKPKINEEQAIEGKGKQKAVATTTIDDACVIDAACIVCCAQVADVVLVPCHHLILCSECCDVMGIHKQGTFIGMGEKKLCPLCRAGIHGRIKVFRG